VGWPGAQPDLLSRSRSTGRCGANPAAKRAELAGRLKTKPAFARFLRTTPGGLLRVDRAAVRADTNFDGKFLLRTSDESLTTADIAQGYKGLYQAERGWRDLKSTIDLRPVYHREDRIRAHVQLQWLALLLPPGPRPPRAAPLLRLQPRRPLATTTGRVVTRPPNPHAPKTPGQPPRMPLPCAHILRKSGLIWPHFGQL